MIQRVRVKEHPIGQFIAEKFRVSFRVEEPPEHLPAVHFSWAFKTAVDLEERVIFLGNAQKRPLEPWEILHEACHINCHPPWEEMGWADEFVVMWGLEHAVTEDLVRRGLLSPEGYHRYLKKHFWKYVTEEGVCVGKYRSTVLEQCLRNSQMVCKKVGLLNRVGRPTYQSAKWDASLEEDWKKFQSFRGISKLPNRYHNSRTRITEVINEDIAKRITKRRGINLELLKKDGKFLSGQICEIPADIGYVTLHSDEKGFSLYGAKKDIDFVQALQ